MTTLTLELPVDIQEQLHRRAEIEDKTLDVVVLDILKKRLIQEDAKPPLSEEARHKRLMERLRNEGKVRPLSLDLHQLIEPGITHEEIQVALSEAGGEPLSGIVIRQRRERYEQLLS
jgi:hypothetical protein